MTSYGLPLYLYHHGIKGMRWGIRRFQKKDGSLTNAGKERYSDDSDKKKKKQERKFHTINLFENTTRKCMEKMNELERLVRKKRNRLMIIKSL